MKRLIISGLIALSVVLTLACSLTSGIPTEEIRRRAIAILGDEVEDELVQDFIVVTPPPTFTITPTPRPCPKPVSLGTYHLSNFNDQSGVGDGAFQLANGLPDGQNSRWEGEADVVRYWSYSLENVISGMITHTLVYTPDDTIASVDLYVHRERLVSVDEPGWVQICTGLWKCSFTAEVGSVMYGLSGPGGVQVDAAVVELTNGCEYGAEVIVAANTPTLTPTGTPTATVESSSTDATSTPQPDQAPTEAPTDSATAVVAPPPTLQPLPTFPPSPTVPLPSPTLPLPTPTVPLPTPTLPPPPTPTSPPSAPPTDPPDTPAPPPTDTPTPEPPPAVAFSAASYSVAENGGSATITVVLSKVWSQTVTVLYTTMDGTATAGSDYTTSSGTLTFNPGVTSLSFNVQIRDDSSVEGDETLTLSLGSPTNATLGTPNVATLTILDNDVPTVQFSSATYSVDEFAGTATITVTLNVPPVVAAMVTYATSNGTATAGSDYTNTSGTLNFAPGQTIATFTIPIINDIIVEPDETLNLTLSVPVNATLGTPNPAVLTIIDDDKPFYVGSFSNSQILQYDGVTGASVGTFASGGGLSGPIDLVFGADGHLYVTSFSSSEVLRYNGTTGAPFGTGSCGNPAAFVCAGSGGLANPVGLTFGPGGNLYVLSQSTDEVLRYNGTTGAPFGTGSCANPNAFVCAGSGGLNGSWGLTFGTGGHLYVSSQVTQEILRYNGTTGAPFGTGSCGNPAAFVCAGSGGVSFPEGLGFRGGNLYVSSRDTNEVLRYNGTTGVPSGTGSCGNPAAFVCAGSGGLSGPHTFVFGLDGNLYLSSSFTNEILRYDGVTGAPFGTGSCGNPAAFVCAGSGGLVTPYGLVFGP